MMKFSSGAPTRGHRLRQGSAPAPFTDPFSVPGLIFNGNTLDSSGYALGTGADVNSFVDRKGVVGNMTQATVLRKPQLVANQFGSLPGIQFTATGSTTDSDFLEATNNVTTSEETIFMVLIVPSAITNASEYILGNDSTSSSYGIRRLNSHFTEFPATGSSAGTQALRGAPEMTLDQPIILSGRRSAVMNAIALFENGSELKKDTHTGTTRGGKFRLGLSAGATYASFTIGALLIYNRYLDDTTRLNIDEWLATAFSVYTPFTDIRTLYRTSRRYAAKNNVTSLASLPLKKILGLCGQSNAEGGAPNAGLSTNLTSPIPGGNIWSYTNLVFEQLTILNCQNAVANQSGPELALMYDFGADFPGALLVKKALGNTSMITRWCITGDLWIAFKAACVAAMDQEGLAHGTRFDWAGVLIYQGEFDADDPTWAAQWGPLCTQIIADFRANIFGASNVKWAIGKTRLDSPTSAAGLAIVQAQQDSVAANVPGVYIVGPWAVSKGDGTHGDATSIRVVANQAGLDFGCTTQVAQ